VGHSFKGRREDQRLLTGVGQYAADWNRPGQLYARFLRSDYAHARIVSLDISQALASPGVRAVLTGADMAAAGFNRGTAHLPFSGRDGALRAPPSPALAIDRVRFVGEPVAIVVADSLAQAEDAAEAILVDYDMLQSVSDGAEALLPGAPALHDSIPGNLCFDYEYGDPAAVERAFADAPHRIVLEMESPRVVGNPMEPKAALAAWDGDVLELWSASQGMTGMRDGMAGLTGVPPNLIRVHARDVGGAFGIRGAAYQEYAALALAARQTGLPVKWVASRSETFVSDYHGRAVRMRGELALDADGHFLAIRHDWICDIGAHPSAAGPSTNVLNAALMAGGAYRIPAIYGRNRLAVTNTVPITAYRGAGRPDMAYAVERLVDQAAHETGIDRVALRRRNLIERDSFPYKISTAPMPASYDSADFGALLDAALAEADWAGFEARRTEARTRGRLRGIGLALFIEPAGGVAPTDQGAITFEPDGTVLLHEVAVASGQGHETVLPQLAADILGIDPALITLHGGRSESPALKGAGAFGSRSIMSQGPVLQAAASAAIDKGKALAANALEASVADLEYADGLYRIVGTDRTMSLLDLAAQHPGALDSTAELLAPRAYPSGAHVAEVEVDPDTGETELLHYISVDDCGVVVNTTLAEGQIWGGLWQGLGQVFGETCRYDQHGQLLSGSFMDYAMPHATELAQRVTIRFVLTPSPSNQLGAKGIGEAGTVGSLPTAVNAVMDALRPAGVEALDMPLTAQRVWQVLNR
jgi:carbon-monoxide dehydrogenase large subunit